MEKIMKINCAYCNTTFERETSYVKRAKKRGTKNLFCSSKCQTKHRTEKSKSGSNCINCGNYFISRTKDNRKFCSQSCSATYNNKNKTTGNKRSKLEQYIEEQLTTTFPSLEILFNSKDAIGSELDIYIPSLSLAFELNGIFHYEPIFGNNKLKSIQDNDVNKTIECAKHKIDLCVIDTTSQKYFKINTSQKFLKIIIDTINSR